jgi:hypothetical protein
MKELMDGIRAAILDGSFDEHARSVLAGAAPYATS